MYRDGTLADGPKPRYVRAGIKLLRVKRRPNRKSRVVRAYFAPRDWVEICRTARWLGLHRGGLVTASVLAAGNVPMEEWVRATWHWRRQNTPPPSHYDREWLPVFRPHILRTMRTLYAPLEDVPAMFGTAWLLWKRHHWRALAPKVPRWVKPASAAVRFQEALSVLPRRDRPPDPSWDQVSEALWHGGNKWRTAAWIHKSIGEWTHKKALLELLEAWTQEQVLEVRVTPAGGKRRFPRTEYRLREETEA